MNANITSEEKKLALNRALAVAGIAGNSQLRDFLEFTAEKVIRGEAGVLTEHIIATRALGQPPDFDPRLDPLVRSCARRVRRKLAGHYRAEGGHEPVWIEIPRGQYLPRFVRPERSLRRALPAIFIAGLAIGFLLLVWGLYLIWPLHRARMASTSGSGETANAILAPFLHDSRRTILAICGLPLVEDSNGNLLRLKDGSRGTLSSTEPESLKRLLVNPEMAHSEALYPAAGITGSGEALSAALIGRHLASRAHGFEVRPWSSLGRQELEESNVLLLGAPGMDAVNLARGNASDFRFVRQRGPSGRLFLAVENLAPASGERTLYEAKMGLAGYEPKEVYALISFLPGRAPGSHWLVVAGSTSEGTLGATEYLTNGRILRDLPQGWSKAGGPPPAFEMLVRVPVRDGRPLSAEYVLHHARQ
ncbi:MAG: hypothetical protein LLG20_01210 [Acidobacteriales bacterium]|nr:hypothetical protein [Terriglobales bacterium]